MVDVIKRPYTTKCNFGVGGTLPATIRWYVVPPTAEPLGMPSIIRDLDWEDELDRYGDVGEVWGQPRKYDTREPPDVTGLKHVCGMPEDFRRGAAAPASPPRQYAPDGLPACCRPLPDALLWGGKNQPVRYSLLYGGEAFTQYCPTYTRFFGTTPYIPMPGFGSPPYTFWRSTGTNEFLYAPGQPPFTGPDEWLYVELFPFGDKYVTTNWDGKGCRMFTKIAGTGPPGDAKICCG